MHTGRPVQQSSGRQSFCALAGLLAGMTIAPAPAAEPTPAPTATVIQKDGPVEVARSGDLAYVTGTYELSETDAKGKPMTDKGKYLEVWKKQVDGNWKCVIDMFNSDLPSDAGEESKPTR